MGIVQEYVEALEAMKVFVDGGMIKLAGDEFDAFLLDLPDARDLREQLTAAIERAEVLERKELEQLERDLENAAYIAELRRGGYLQKQAIAIAERGAVSGSRRSGNKP